VSLRLEDYFDSNEEIFNTLVNNLFKKVFSKLSKAKGRDFVKKMPGFAIWILTMLLLIEAYEGIKPSQAIPSRG
jgi:plasmid replication initiation protein